MQIYDKKPEATPWKPQKSRNKSPEVEAPKASKRAKPKVPVAETYGARKAEQKSKSSSPKNAQALAGLGSAFGSIGAVIASSSQTAATACRMASTNPVMMGIGVTMIVIGFGAVIYFKYLQ